jgi:uncharacterized membrane protein
MISLFNTICFFLISRMRPEKNINKYFGYRTKKSMLNKENWNKAQEEMILYARVLARISILLSIFFSFLEIIALTIFKSEDLFVGIVIFETFISLAFFLKLYFHVERRLP